MQGLGAAVRGFELESCGYRAKVRAGGWGYRVGSYGWELG